jgi:hypothetical protein
VKHHPTSPIDNDTLTSVGSKNGENKTCGQELFIVTPRAPSRPQK